VEEVLLTTTMATDGDEGDNDEDGDESNNKWLDEVIGL